MNKSADSAPARGDLLDITIEKVIFGGDGLARLPQGFVLFVPFAAEGDRLRVRIIERKAQHARAEIVTIVQPGAGRDNPPCPYYAQCGGCQYQHLTYAEECRLKENQVREAFARVGKLPDAPIRALIPSPQPYGYRNRITVHAEAGRVGFRGVDGRELVDVTKCLLARDDVNAQLTRLRGSRPADGHYSLRDAAVPPSGFFQANHELRDRLKELIAQALPERGAMLLEGYCGGGFFTEIVAERFARVTAIDNDPRTLLDARRLALANVDWREADAAFALPEELAALRESERAEASVLVDPPREGLPVRLVEALCAYSVAHLAYVSCDPATLARDARMLAKTYRLLAVQPIDLFPRTAQIECVSIWSK
ncbi:MAG TPA: TRAM domain-containing protein [Candidatus Methylacidiphilales bacterium]|nr:TRAM domain-containing protein [Candidatus Methylacidiphilales bacterium]